MIAHAGGDAALRRQLPQIDSPEMLAEYRKLADEAEALAAMVAANAA